MFRVKADRTEVSIGWAVSVTAKFLVLLDSQVETDNLCSNRASTIYLLHGISLSAAAYSQITHSAG